MGKDKKKKFLESDFFFGGGGGGEELGTYSVLLHTLMQILISCTGLEDRNIPGVIFLTSNQPVVILK